MARLGTKKRLTRGHVQTFERAQTILAMCDDRGWTAKAGSGALSKMAVNVANRYHNF